MEELKYWIALSKFNKIGPKRFQLLNNYFANLRAIWEASFIDLKQTGLEESIAEEFIAVRQTINPDQELEKISRENIKVLTILDKNYPTLLKEIHNPPFLLYYKGNLKALRQPTLAVVGTRKMTTYGRQVLPPLIRDLLAADLVIVSGLALGIDSLAHLTSVQNHRPTIAILAGGLDAQNIYPATNRSLIKNILDNNGLILSEYPVGTLALKHHFPNRNRLISGLSLGTLVVEAGESSGALITAKYALEQNREVFAIPGPITNPLSVGTNNLIKQGAKLVADANDIFEELNLRQLQNFKINQAIIPDSPEEATVLQFLQQEPRHINELARLTALTMPELNATLMLLEMKGKIKNLGNMTYVINR